MGEFEPGCEDSSRARPLRRALKLLRRLEASGGRWIPIRDLAAELEVTERTVRRDLGALQEVGMAIETSGSTGFRGHVRGAWEHDGLPVGVPPPEDRMPRG